MNKKLIVIIVIAIVAILAIGGFLIFNSNSSKTRANQADTANSNMNREKNNLVTNESENLNSENTTEIKDNKILIAFFSRADENYSVGIVEVGNTEIMANNIAELTGGDLFKIEPVNSYPTSYDDATDVARQEKDENARPEMKNTINNIDEYDTIFIGYPIWWNDMPMCVYTFLESYDFSGKTIIPFNTHEGSGNAGTYMTIKNKLTDSDVLDGLAIRGINAREDSSKQTIEIWIKELNIEGGKRE